MTLQGFQAALCRVSRLIRNLIANRRGRLESEKDVGGPRARFQRAEAAGTTGSLNSLLEDSMYTP